MVGLAPLSPRGPGSGSSGWVTGWDGAGVIRTVLGTDHH